MTDNKELIEAIGEAIDACDWVTQSISAKDFKRVQGEAALSAIKAAGWAVVPVEPTEEMNEAGVVVWADALKKNEDWRRYVRETYKAMIAVASPAGSETPPQVNRIDWVCSECGETPRKLFEGDPHATEEGKTFYDGWQCPLHWWPSSGCDGVLEAPPPAGSETE